MAVVLAASVGLAGCGGSLVGFLLGRSLEGTSPCFSCFAGSPAAHRERSSSSSKSSNVDGKRRVALGVCGSVAAVKVPELVKLLVASDVYVDVVLTHSAAFFMDVEYNGQKPAEALQHLCDQRDADGVQLVTVWRDADEWDCYKRVGDDVVHVNLAKRNLALILAPLDSNTLSKVVHGLSDNLLTCLIRAWYWGTEKGFAEPINQKYGSYALQRPVIVAPAMNTIMWHQQLTQNGMVALRRMGAFVIQPVVKKLACGDTGAGAMANSEDIVAAAIECLNQWEAAETSALEEGKLDFGL